MSDKLHQAVELIICQHSPQYFFQKYLREAFKYRGFDYEDLEYHTEWYNSQDPALYLRASRRTGVSVSTVARLVWELTFKTEHKSAVLGSRKVTSELTHDIMTCIHQLPEWMKPKIEYHSRYSIATESKNVLIVGEQSLYAIRGHSIDTLYFVDIQLTNPIVLEAAIADALPTLRYSKGIIRFTSTGRVNVSSLAVISRLNPTVLFVGWDVLPGSDDQYRDVHIKTMGEQHWEQHFELSVP